MTGQVDLQRLRHRVEPFLRGLRRLAPLSEDTEALLVELAQGSRHFEAGDVILREGKPPAESYVLLSGIADSFKQTEDAGRQILAFHVAGDILGVEGLLIGKVDYSVRALTVGEVGVIDHAALSVWFEQRPALMRAFWSKTLLNAAIYREWVFNIARRSPRERVAHILCEVLLRLRSADALDDLDVRLPLTRQELSDASGLGVVSVARILSDLTSEGLIVVNGESVDVLDDDGLRRVAKFDSTYLRDMS